MEILKLLQEGDSIGLEMEKAREALEAAKLALEQAKEQFEEVKGQLEQIVTKAEEAGIPRAKFKKLVEERVAAMWASGLIQSNDQRPKIAKAPRISRKAKSAESDSSFSEPNETMEPMESFDEPAHAPVN